MDSIIPKAPPEVCFESNAFSEEHFSVDNFLQNHRNEANLEAMRDDLGLYLKVLRSAMVELINKDYADFVDLSSNLIGLDKAISNIQTPLGQLKEELVQVSQSLDEAMYEVTVQLAHKRELRNQRRSLKSFGRVQSALKKLECLLAPVMEGKKLELLVLERAVAELNQLHFHWTKCIPYLTKDEDMAYKRLEEALVKSVDTLFLESVTSGEKGKEGLVSSLSFYLMLGKEESVERLYRKAVVAAVMNPIINEETLRSLPRGLPALYEKILAFVDKDMKVLMEVVKEEPYPGLGKLDFFVRSFWPEVEQNLELNLGSIYAAGDPEVFYQRYCETLVFIDELKARCASEEALKELHEHPSFTDFMDRWNLPVYFQIRFQEIVKIIEQSFVKPDPFTTGEWKLAAIQTSWECLNRCWEPGVFLQPITYKFWKLTLQILSRLNTWVGDVLQKNVKDDPSKFLVFLYTDIEHLLSKLPDFEEIVRKKLVGVSEKTLGLLHESLDESRIALNARLEQISTALVTFLSKDCATSLRQVNEIPRLFRLTNREQPSRPCAYVQALLQTSEDFHKNHGDHPQSSVWLQRLLSDLTKKYYAAVTEVLTFVQKIEETLRKLKKARVKGPSTAQSDRRAGGDDDKIRLQLFLDVSAYAEGVLGLGVPKNKIEMLDDLLLLVEPAQKS